MMFAVVILDGFRRNGGARASLAYGSAGNSNDIATSFIINLHTYNSLIVRMDRVAIKR